MSKSKVAIITFCTGINYGAFLQCYSLKKYIESTFNSKVDVIDLSSFSFRFQEILYVLLKERKPFLCIHKIKHLIKSQREHLNIIPYSFFKKNISDYDKIIFGSDEIWNLNSPACTNDLRYFASGIIDFLSSKNKLISYACSFGNYSSSLRNINSLKNKLDKFNAHSVRDFNSFNLMSSINLKSKLVCDPTYLLFSTEHANIYNTKVLFKNYILLYGTNFKSLELTFLSKFSKKYNFQIISVGFYSKLADKNLFDLNSFEFVSLIKNSNFVFTNMFHGTVYSSMYAKSFCYCLTDYRKAKFDNIIRELKLEKNKFNPKNMNINLYKNNSIDEIKLFKQTGVDYLKSHIDE